MRFAFYGRVSTEDQQDPTASRGWQLARARALIEPQGGVIVAEYFDIGQSRSLPWPRRPEAAALLEGLRDPGRGFDAVVIGEPARAFYGHQCSLTFPVFVHFDVELWVPEVGGRVDPGSEAHDLVMSMYGGMSKGERQRIKIRVRAAMADQAAREGRFLGGRPPYGYTLGDAGAHPNPAKAADGRRLHRLEVDPVAAPIVVRIFDQYLAGAGLYAIAEGLTRDRVPSPSAHDPLRNRHRHGRAWSKAAVRAILRNPRYTGRQVWNRQRRDEVLVDVDDVAAGHISKMRWNDRADWVWSAAPTHAAIIDVDTFARVQEQMAAGVNRPATRKPRRSARPYVLRGLLDCGICGRRMAGHWLRGETRYRCRYPTEYALANDVDHPRTVYVREDEILPALDAWLATVFAPEHLDNTCEQLAAAASPSDSDTASIEAARRHLADCDKRLERYRTALDKGADAMVVAAWSAVGLAARRAAEKMLAAATPSAKMSATDARTLIEGLGDVATVLAAADPAKKADLYETLGLRLVYQPTDSVVVVEATMCATARVGGGT
jgi:DNA invertase Pin-like site-specific DNA recombinase